jgi:hypothetical protein
MTGARSIPENAQPTCSMSDQEENCLFLRKPECFPYELVEKVKNILER